MWHLRLVPFQLHAPPTHFLEDLDLFFFYLSFSLSLSLTHPLCLILCHSLYSLFMVQSQSELKCRAMSLRQQRSRSSRTGSWETGSPPRSRNGECSSGMLLPHAHTHASAYTNTHARACAHTPDRRPTKQEDGEERGDEMERQDRQNQAGQ